MHSCLINHKAYWTLFNKQRLKKRALQWAAVWTTVLRDQTLKPNLHQKFKVIINLIFKQQDLNSIWKIVKVMMMCFMIAPLLWYLQTASIQWLMKMKIRVSHFWCLIWEEAKKTSYTEKSKPHFQKKRVRSKMIQILNWKGKFLWEV